MAIEGSQSLQEELEDYKSVLNLSKPICATQKTIRSINDLRRLTSLENSFKKETGRTWYQTKKSYWLICRNSKLSMYNKRKILKLVWTWNGIQ